MKRRTFCTIIILMICVLMMAAAGCGEQGRTDIAASTEISVPVETVETPDPEETEAEEPVLDGLSDLSLRLPVPDRRGAVRLPLLAGQL